MAAAAHARGNPVPTPGDDPSRAVTAPDGSLVQLRLQGVFLTVIGLAGMFGGVMFSIEAPRFTPVPVVFLTFWLIMVIVGRIFFTGLSKLRSAGVGAPAPEQVRAAAAVAGIVVAVGMMGFAATGPGAGVASAAPCPGGGPATCGPGPGPELTITPPAQQTTAPGGQQGNQGSGQDNNGIATSPAGSGGNDGGNIQAQTPDFGAPGQQAPNIPGNEQPGQGNGQAGQPQGNGQGQQNQNPTVQTTAPGGPQQSGQQQPGQTNSGQPSSPTATVTKTESQCAVPGTGNGAGTPGSPGGGDSNNNGGGPGPDNGDGEHKDGAPSWAYLVGEVSALMTGRRGRKAGPLNPDGSAPTNDMIPNDQVDGENYKEWTTPDGKRTFILSENADAPSQYRFNINEVDRPEGGSVDVNDDGSLSTYDREGNEVDRFTPWAYDTVTGEKIPTWFTRDGDDLVQTIDRPAGNNNPILADPPGDDETPGRGGASGEGADNSSPEPAPASSSSAQTDLATAMANLQATSAALNPQPGDPGFVGPVTQQQIDQRATENAQAIAAVSPPPAPPTDPAPSSTPQQDLAAATAGLTPPRTYGPTVEESQAAGAAIAEERERATAAAPGEWNRIFGEEGEQYKKFFPKDVYPVEKTTSVHNGVYTTTYRMSNGARLSQIEDNGGEYPAYWDRIDDSPELGSGKIDPSKGIVTRDYTGAQILTTTLDNIDTALSLVPPLKPEGAAVKGIAKGVRAATGTPKERETVNVGDKITDKPDTTPPVKPDTTPPVKPDETPPVKPDTTVPVKPDETIPIKPDVTPPVKPDTTVPVKPDETIPVKPDVTSPVKPEGSPGTRLADGVPAPGNPWPRPEPSFSPPKTAPDTVQRLPSGRRPSNSNWAGHTYDFRNTPETQGKLLEEFPNGVYFGKNGFPDFGPYSIQTVRIEGGFTGRRADYAKADAIAGYGPSNPRPKDYVWHHHEDGVTMQLVPEGVHDGARHAGGIALVQGPKGTARIR